MGCKRINLIIIYKEPVGNISEKHELCLANQCFSLDMLLTVI